MRGSNLHNHINDALSTGQSFAPPELSEAIHKHDQWMAKNWENQNPYLYGETFSSKPITQSNNKRIQTIIDGIKTLGIPLKLYKGNAKSHCWEGDQLENKTTKTIDQWKITNEENHILRFDLDDDDGMGRVHVVMYEVDQHEQGSWISCKRFWHDQLKPILLEHCGFSSIWGRATYSIDHPVRGNPTKAKDWRRSFKFMGYDSRLRPIFVNKLWLFYMRLGFIPSPAEIIQVEQGLIDVLEAKEIHLLSDQIAQGIKAEIGGAAWSELTKFDVRRIKEWNAIQRKRITQVDPLTAQKIRHQTLAGLIKRRHELEQ